MCSGEPLMSGSGEAAAPSDYLSERFDNLFDRHIEITLDSTVMRLALQSGGLSTFSRVDRKTPPVRTRST